MSRWLEEFQRNPIHETLEKCISLAADNTNLSSEIEVERRRLLKVLNFIEDVLKRADPEFLKFRDLNHLNQILKNEVEQKLEKFAQTPSRELLEEANSNINPNINLINNLVNFGLIEKLPEGTEGVKDRLLPFEILYDSFTKKVAGKEKEIFEAVERAKVSVAGLEHRAKDLKDRFSEFESNFSSFYQKMEKDFSDSQIKRDEEYSRSKIDFEEKMKQRLSESTEELKLRNAEILDKSEADFEKALDAFSHKISVVSEDVTERHKNICELHDLVATDSVAGAYQSSASREKISADRLRLVAFLFGCLAGVWLLYRIVCAPQALPNQVLDYTSIISTGSLTVVLILISGYAARQSELHRRNQQRMHWFFLEIKALEPFLASLPKEKQAEMKAELAIRMFGQNQTSLSQAKSASDIESTKGLIETVFSNVKDSLKLK